MIDSKSVSRWFESNLPTQFTWQGGVGELLRELRLPILGSSSAGRATKNHKSCLGQKKLFDFYKKI